jgi:hypothetical protein
MGLSNRIRNAAERLGGTRGRASSSGTVSGGMGQRTGAGYGTAGYNSHAGLRGIGGRIMGALRRRH